MSLNADVDDRQSEIKEPQFPQSTALPVQSIALTIIAVLAMVLVLQYAQAMIIPIVLGMLISHALEPMVGWFERRHPARLSAALSW